MKRIRFLKMLLAVLALAICTGTMHAAAAFTPPSAIGLTCNTGTGPAQVATAINVKLLAAGSALTGHITSSPSGVLVLPPDASVSSTTANTAFNVNTNPDCAGAYNGEVVTVTIAPTTGVLTSVSVAVTITVTGPTVLTSAQAGGVTINCDTGTGPVGLPVGIKIFAGAASVQVTPAVPQGSPFAAAPSPAAVNSTTIATSFTFTMLAGCAGANDGDHFNLTFTPLTGTVLTIQATVHVTGAAIIKERPTIILSCDMSSGSAGPVTVGMELKTAGAMNVSVTDNPSGILTLPSATSVTATGSFTEFSFNFKTTSPCGGATNGGSVTLTFTPAGGSGVPVTVLASLVITTPTLASIKAPSFSLSCDTQLGPTNVNIPVTLYAAASGYPVTATSADPGKVLVTAPLGGTTVASTTTPLIWVARAPAGCVGLTTGDQVAINFVPTGSSLQTMVITANITVTHARSALSVSPAAVTVTCQKNSNGSWAAPATATVNVTSAAAYGTPFTVDATSFSAYPYLTVTGNTTAGASASQIALTVSTNSCATASTHPNPITVSLANVPAPAASFVVNFQTGGAPALTATTANLAYVLGETTHNAGTSTIGGTTGTFFLVDQTTVPLWLTTGVNSFTLSGSSYTMSFTPNGFAESLAVGNYSASIHLKVTGSLDTLVPILLQVKSSSTKLAVVESKTQALSFVFGTTPPTLMLTPISVGDAPIPYSVTATGSVTPTLSASNGVAYSFGPPITVTFPGSAFAATAVNGSQIFTVVFHATADGSTHTNDVTVNVTITVISPNARITGISPQAEPTAVSPQTFTVVITGTGFVVDSNPTSVVRTVVGVVSAAGTPGAAIVNDASITATVLSSTTIDLLIRVPSNPDPFLPFTGAGGTVTFGVCNPGGLTCFTPTDTVLLSIGVNPIVHAVTSASSYMQPTPPILPSIAPYDIASIFGMNFCVAGGVGCLGNNAVLYAATDPSTLKYPTQLSPDGTNNLSVTFQTHDSSPSVIATAPLLFATNQQINLLVPAAVSAYAGKTVDLVVNYGTGSSLPFSITITATNPGVFAMSNGGLGDAAALFNGTATLVSQAAPASVNATGQDTLQLYVTGLGMPDTTGMGTSDKYSFSCIDPEIYWPLVNTNADYNAANGGPVSHHATSTDGLVLQYNLLSSPQTMPCIADANKPTVTVGAATATVGYAGWVSGSVAGLYQINITLPATGFGSNGVLAGGGTSAVNSTAPVKLPVVFTMGSLSSQPSGVNLWVVTRPTIAAIDQTLSKAAAPFVNQAAFTVSGGGASQTFTAAGLPAGVTMDSATGSLSGTPSGTNGVFVVTVTIVDTNGWTGVLILNLTIAD